MDHQALTRAMDDCLAALTARDTGRFAPARYTENGQDLAVGEGLWATADRIGPYRHIVADPDSGQAACFATVTEGRTRSIMALRLALSGDGATSEIEVLVARPSLRGGTDAFGDGPAELDRASGPDPAWLEPIPAAERASREDLQRVADMYFIGLEGNDGRGDYPFADDCIRIENGFRATDVPPAPDGEGQTPYAVAFRALSARAQFESGFFRFVSRIRERRFPVIDTERGVVFAFAFFDHFGTLREYELADGTPITHSLDRPFSWMIAEAFRIENGLFTRIEALMLPVPFGMKSGW